MKAFLIDIGICNGCYNCQIACKDEHCSNDWRPYAAPQRETGQFWVKVNEYIRGTVPKVKMHYIPVLCQHCDEAPCMKAAPDAVHKRADGLVVIDPDKAQGNRGLVDSCPYGAIFYNEELALAQKCTGCAHLLDRGWSEPRCVDACPTGALQFEEEEELDLAGTEPLFPGAPGRPRVYYRNIPKTFVGGTLYDSEKKEIVEAATLILTAADGHAQEKATNGWGDFWFEDLPKGTYSLEITAQGYQPKSLTGISTMENSVNLGDVALR
ncbi:MAG: carboxypeptidase regulatory-like domain-containing protein [Thermoleophilia bacterium]|nr:carboxypeptidase regulatory-like domain-containing protein [Thermoleophilia bacterium]